MRNTNKSNSTQLKSKTATRNCKVAVKSRPLQTRQAKPFRSGVLFEATRAPKAAAFVQGAPTANSLADNSPLAARFAQEVLLGEQDSRVESFQPPPQTDADAIARHTLAKRVLLDSASSVAQLKLSVATSAANSKQRRSVFAPPILFGNANSSLDLKAATSYDFVIGATAAADKDDKINAAAIANNDSIVEFKSLPAAEQLALPAKRDLTKPQTLAALQATSVALLDSNDRQNSASYRQEIAQVSFLAFACSFVRSNVYRATQAFFQFHSLRCFPLFWPV